MGRHPHIVIVEEGKEFARCGLEAGIARCCSASLGNRNVDGAEIAGDLPGFRICSVVADQNLESDIVGLQRTDACEGLA
jgi:hypothetical protein